MINNTTISPAQPFPTLAETLLAPSDQRFDVLAGLQWLLRVLGASTVVTIHADDGRVDARWLDETTVGHVATWLNERNRADGNAYFTVNATAPGLAKKPTKQEIVALRAAAFADLDAKDGRTLDQARRALALLPSPSVIIASGGGYQPIWLLPEPLPVTPEETARSETLSDCIAKIAGGDNVKNIDRILRLPFTINHPNQKKRAAGREACLSGLLRSGEAT